MDDTKCKYIQTHTENKNYIPPTHRHYIRIKLNDLGRHELFNHRA